MKPDSINKIYIGASSKEIARATMWTDKIRAAGFDVTSAWITNIAEQSAANPRDAKREDRSAWSLADLIAIKDADLVWVLVPPSNVSTCGAWVEAGYAYALDKYLVFSGDTKQSIFTALASEFEADIDAFARICAMRVGR